MALAAPECTHAGDADPDSRARTHLANERTYLAWFRTGVTLIALGLAAAQFLGRTDVTGVPLHSVLAIVLVGLGIAVALLGAWRYAVTRRRIDGSGYEPARDSVAIATVAVVVVGAIAIGFIWVASGQR